MVARAIIEEACQAIVEAFHPQRVILFGSHAYGSPGPDSDMDFLVIMPFEGSPIRKAAEVSLRIPRRSPVDVLVRTPEQVQERLALNDFFMREIIEKGLVLYDAADTGMGEQGRR